MHSIRRRSETPSALGNVALQGVSWTTLATGIQVVVQTGTLMGLARLLTPEDFGMMSIGVMVIGLAEMISQYGLGFALVQRPSLTEQHIRAAYLLAIAFSVASTILLLVFAPSIATFFERPQLTAILRLLSVGIILDGLLTIAASQLQRDLRFQELAMGQLAAYILGGSIAAIAMAMLGLGVWTLVYAYLIQAVLKTTIFLSQVSLPRGISTDTKSVRDLVGFGSGMTFERVSVYLAAHGDSAIVGKFLGASVLGLYDRAYRLMALPADLFGMAVDRVLFATMSQVQSEADRLRPVFRRSLFLVATGLIPLSVFLFITAPEIIAVVLGSQWMDAVVPFRILVIGMYFHTAHRISGNVARARGAVYALAWRHALYAFLIIAGTYVGSQWGIQGIAIVVVCVVAIHFILTLHIVISMKILVWRDLLSLHLPASFIAVVSGLVVYAIVSYLRADGASPFWVLSAAGMTGALATCIVLYWWPSRLTNEDGAWWYRVALRLAGRLKASSTVDN